MTFALGIALVAGGSLEVLFKRRVRAPPVVVLFLTGLVLWSAITLCWARDQRWAMERTKTAVQLLAFVWIAWQIARSRRDVAAMAAGYLVGCTVAALAVLREFQAGRVAYEFEVRYVARGFDPNDLGITLAIGIPIALYLAQQSETRWRALWLSYMPLAVTAIALSGSRSASLAGVVASAFVLAFGRHRNASAIAAALALIVIGAAVAWQIVPQETWARIFSLGDSVAHGTMGGRSPIWAAALDIWAEHPMLGVGIGGFGDAVAPIVGEHTAPHNALLSVGAELGLVGVLLFVAAVASAVFDAFRNSSLERALLGGVLGAWSIGAMSLTWDFGKVTWFVLLLGAAVRASSGAQVANRAPPSGGVT